MYECSKQGFTFLIESLSRMRLVLRLRESGPPYWQLITSHWLRKLMVLKVLSNDFFFLCNLV